MNTSMSPLGQSATPRLILASGSQARLAVLRAAGIAVTVQPSTVDEDAAKADARLRRLDAGAAALMLAELKARQVDDPDALVIGADQILVCDERWFDKPGDLETAASHLRLLRGRTHVLHTAVVVLRGGQVVWQHVATPRLHMREFSEAFLQAYVAAEDEHLFSSVGAYRLEALGIQLFDVIDGEHAAILGLPILLLLDFLRREGVLPT